MRSYCYFSVCFFHLSKDVPKFFGFAEYLAAVALMALAWIIADVRYKFRVATAPIPLQITTFSVVAGIGLLTLLTDLWRAEQWLVPEGKLSSAGWQALLGFVFLSNFMVWVWFAFIRPPAYSKWNAYRFARALYRAVLRGSPTELPEIADELARSAPALVRNAWQVHENELAARMAPAADKKPNRNFLVRQCAHEIILLIADKKFCRHSVSSAPIIALALFEELKAQKRYGISLGTFARNFTSEAIANKDSFAFHESEGYFTGFIGYQKPITRALYGNYIVVEQLNRVFDLFFEEQRRWDSEQWQAFCRLLLVTAKDFFANGVAWQYPPVFGRAFDDIKNSVVSLSKINGDPFGGWQDEELNKLNVAVDFAVDFVKIMDEHAHKLNNITLRRKERDRTKDVCDMVADLMFDLIIIASDIKKPRNLCWSVQHNCVWEKFFEEPFQKNTVAWMVSFKLKRLLLKEVSEISNKFPNYKNTRVLGMLLNVMGLKEHRMSYGEATHSLHRAVLRWTIRNYARLAEQSPTVMENVLVEGLTYDPQTPSLIYTREPLLDRKAEPVVLKLAPFVRPQATE